MEDNMRKIKAILYLIISIMTLLNLTQCTIDTDIDDAASTVAETIENQTEATSNNYDQEEMSDASVDYDDDVFDPEETGLQILDNDGVPSNRHFMGTFLWVNGIDRCDEFPIVTRLYSYDEYIYIESNQQDLIAEAVLFEDGTFDFGFGIMDEFGYLDEYACTCFYEEYEWYKDEWKCSCDGELDNCSLNYRMMQ